MRIGNEGEGEERENGKVKSFHLWSRSSFIFFFPVLSFFYEIIFLVTRCAKVVTIIEQNDMMR